MPQPGSIGSIVPLGDDWLGKRLRDLQQQIDQLKTAIPQAMASRNFDGTLDPAAAGTQGWGLTASGDAIFNNVILRGGIIGNDALTSPIKAQAYYDRSGGYAIAPSTGGAATVRASFTVTIPDGFTAAFLFASVQDYGYNASGGADYLHSCVSFGVPGIDWLQASSATVPNMSGGSAICVTTDQRTGLTGGATIAVESRPYVEYGTWPSDPANSTLLSAMAIFFR